MNSCIVEYYLIPDPVISRIIERTSWKWDEGVNLWLLTSEVINGVLHEGVDTNNNVTQ